MPADSPLIPPPPSRPLSSDWLLRFGGIARLYGAGSLERLAAARVAVVGVGGVGSWTAEGLVRSGIGEITLIDMDDVCITNTNRQMPALAATVGQPKVDVVARRLREINPECRVITVPEFLTESSVDRLLPAPSPDAPNPRYDWVIDAVDRTSTKALIIATCCARNMGVLTIGGAGGRRDSSAFRVADLAFSVRDDLLRGVKKYLRRHHGFPGGENQPMGLPCVYSAEPRLYPWADGTCRVEAEPAAAGTSNSLRMDCASGFGAAMHVTATAGLMASGEVVRRIAEAVAR